MYAYAFFSYERDWDRGRFLAQRGMFQATLEPEECQDGGKRVRFGVASMQGWREVPMRGEQNSGIDDSQLIFTGFLVDCR
jgi:hypothetical protein